MCRSWQSCHIQNSDRRTCQKEIRIQRCSWEKLKLWCINNELHPDSISKDLFNGNLARYFTKSFPWNLKEASATKSYDSWQLTCAFCHRSPPKIWSSFLIFSSRQCFKRWSRTSRVQKAQRVHLTRKIPQAFPRGPSVRRSASAECNLDVHLVPVAKRRSDLKDSRETQPDHF